MTKKAIIIVLIALAIAVYGHVYDPIYNLRHITASGVKVIKVNIDHYHKLIDGL